MRPNYPTILANPITKGQQGVGQPKYTHLPKWEKILSYPSYSSSCTEHPRAAANRLPPQPANSRNTHPKAGSSRADQTQRGQPDTTPRLFPVQVLYILLYEPHALFKDSSPQSVATAPQINGVGGRGPKVACIHLTLGLTDLHFKNGIRPCLLTYQWYHRRALSGSDTPIPIYPKLRTPTYPIYGPGGGEAASSVELSPNRGSSPEEHRPSRS